MRRARATGAASTKHILVIDVGGSSVKMQVSGSDEERKFPSGPTLTPKAMVTGVLEAVRDWKFDVVTIGYPGPVVRGKPVAEPRNLGQGWVGFDFAAALGRPIPSSSSTTPPCRRSAATRAAACSSSDSAPASARP
jgi:predicted NBD/HSP70 family sugar kinase